jgi:hypothetical protein
MKTILGFVALLLLAGMCVAQSDQPSLADIAKANKAKKTDAKAKVITNDDIPAVTAGGAVNVSTASVAPVVDSSKPADASGKSADKPDAKTAKGGDAQPKDKSEVAELKKQLSSYTQQRDGWKKLTTRNEELLANEQDEFRRQTYQDALDADRQNVTYYQQKMDNTQAQLDKIQQGQSGEGQSQAASQPPGSNSNNPPQ